MTERSIQELFSLNGKVALVTGGAMGIGKGIVTRLAEAGASVLFTDLNVEEAQKTVGELCGHGYTVDFTRADASSVSDAERATQEAVSKYGSLDILVNNAGIYPMKPMMEITESLWDKVMSINVKGTFFYTQAAARKMAESGKGGAVVNLASIDALHPTGNLVHYDASKGAVVMMTKAMALELGKLGVRVNAIAPGGITTPGATAGSSAAFGQMTPDQIAEMMKSFTARIPLGRQGLPDDIAKAALFLASEASAYMTGETIVVDGGFLLS